MRLSRVGKGRKGEDAAVKFLKRKGFKILERNFRTRFGEIDLVCMKGERVIFVEVKAKTGERFGEPWEMVDERKINQIKRMGKFYLMKNGMNDSWCRLDVVGVWLRDGKVEKLEHWENVGDLT